MPTSDHTPRQRDPALSLIRETALSFIRLSGGVGDRPPPRPAEPPDLAIIDQLCAWSFSPQPLVAKAATAAIFGCIIETLSDDFSDHGVHLGNLVLTRILQYIRKTPAGTELDQLLDACGFSEAAALLDRYQRIRQGAPLTAERLRSVKKIIILSRVTAGADIAITNVIIQRLRQRCAEAELVLVGPAHLSEIFGFVAHCRHRSFIYKNDGSLFDKMTSWPRLLEITRDEQQGHQAGEVLLFDPDTRLSQLGLLPLAPDDCTCYFPSRASQAGRQAHHNLSTLTNHWLNQLLGEELSWRPNLVFQREGEGYHALCQALHRQGCRLVVTINFGVGNDPRKKVHGSFEEDLIQALLALPDTVVILDTGRGDQKGQWIADHLARVRGQEWPAACLTDADLSTETVAFGHGLIIFKGTLGALGKMIDAADCFIGYDSCGQHLAAATSTPSIIVFAGAPTPRFIQRWSPDTTSTLTIPVDGLTASPQKISHLIKQITQAVETIRGKLRTG